MHDSQVFARVSPDQKELVLRTLRAAGWTTLMCGDGTNDVGALKAAHVGVALLPPSEAQLKAQKEREEQFNQRKKDIAARKAALRSGVRPPPISNAPASPSPSLGQLVAPGPSEKGMVSTTGPGKFLVVLFIHCCLLLFLMSCAPFWCKGVLLGLFPIHCLKCMSV